MAPADLPLISVIIPCYNGAQYISEALDSVLRQRYPKVEIIVVDDGSTDRSAEILTGYGDKITVVSQANAGLPAARNSGIAVAQGEFYGFLDADDCWGESFLAELHAAAQREDAGIAYCGWQNVGLPGTRGEPFVPPDYEHDPDKQVKLIQGVRWPVHAALVRASVCKAVGGFNPELRSCEDFAFWIRTATKNKLVLVPKVLAFYRHHGDQMTSNRLRIVAHHFRVQREFLAENPDIAHKLGREKVAALVFGELLHKGYEAYWRRDIDTARFAFRTALKARHFGPRDLKYLLPALLPKGLHEKLVGLSDGARQDTPS